MAGFEGLMLPVPGRYQALRYVACALESGREAASNTLSLDVGVANFRFPVEAGAVLSVCLKQSYGP